MKLLDKGKMEYNKLSDEQLAVLAKNNDGEAEEVLIKRYIKSVNMIARKYYIIGCDTEDLEQFGLIAVAKAIRSYQEGHNFSFYVLPCIKNAIITEIKKSKAQKQMALNSSVSVENLCDEFGDVISRSNDPESEILSAEYVQEFKCDLKNNLSKLEYKIFDMFLKGYSYQEIGKELNKEVKSVDNAMQRIRKKSAVIIKEGKNV